MRRSYVPIWAGQRRVSGPRSAVSLKRECGTVREPPDVFAARSSRGPLPAHPLHLILGSVGIDRVFQFWLAPRWWPQKEGDKPHERPEYAALSSFLLRLHKLTIDSPENADLSPPHENSI